MRLGWELLRSKLLPERAISDEIFHMLAHGKSFHFFIARVDVLKY